MTIILCYSTKMRFKTIYKTVLKRDQLKFNSIEMQYVGMQGYPLRGAEPRGIPLNNILLPEYLRRFGYATHLVGKWHVGYHTKNYGPTRRGFDNFVGYYNGYIQYFNHTLYENVSFVSLFGEEDINIMKYLARNIIKYIDVHIFCIMLQ